MFWEDIATLIKAIGVVAGLGVVLMTLKFIVDLICHFFMQHPKIGKAALVTFSILLAAAIGAGAGGYFGYHQGEDVGQEIGRAAGYDDGYFAGYKKGKADGESNQTAQYNAGYDAGYDSGYDDGYDTGYDTGYSAGKRSGGGGGSTSSSQQQSVTVYVTNTGSKYHKSWCSYLHSSRNAVSLSWAKSNGYGACSRCW